jgi:hypothetical protein
MFGHSDPMWIWGYILTAIVGAIGAIITWFIADFIAGLIARPLLHFFELRSKVAEGLAEFDNVLPRGRSEHGVIELIDLSADEDARLKEAQKTFRELGAQMLALPPIAAWIVKIGWKYDVTEASSALFAYSSELYKPALRDGLRAQIRRVLRIP